MFRLFILLVVSSHLAYCSTRREDGDLAYHDRPGIVVKPTPHVPDQTRTQSISVKQLVWMYDHGMSKHGEAMRLIIEKHCSRNPFNKHMQKDLPYCIRHMH